MSDKLNVYRICIEFLYKNMRAMDCARIACFVIGWLAYDDRTVRVD